MDEDAGGGLNPTTEEERLQAWRRDLLDELPGLIRRALRGYERFADGPAPEDAKGFVAYQAGCRAALTHIHLLVKLADWARSGGKEAAPPFDTEQLDRLVREAEAALREEPVEDA